MGSQDSSLLGRPEALPASSEAPHAPAAADEAVEPKAVETPHATNEKPAPAAQEEKAPAEGKKDPIVPASPDDEIAEPFLVDEEKEPEEEKPIDTKGRVAPLPKFSFTHGAVEPDLVSVPTPSPTEKPIDKKQFSSVPRVVVSDDNGGVVVPFS